MSAKRSASALSDSTAGEISPVVDAESTDWIVRQLSAADFQTLFPNGTASVIERVCKLKLSDAFRLLVRCAKQNSIGLLNIALAQSNVVAAINVCSTFENACVTALFTACIHNNPIAALRILAEPTCDVNQCNYLGMDVLWYVSAHDSLNDVLVALLKRPDVDPNKRRLGLVSAIERSLFAGAHANVVSMFESGKVVAQTPLGCQPAAPWRIVHLAASLNDVPCLELCAPHTYRHKALYRSAIVVALSFQQWDAAQHLLNDYYCVHRGRVAQTRARFLEDILVKLHYHSPLCPATLPNLHRLLQNCSDHPKDSAHAREMQALGILSRISCSGSAHCEDTPYSVLIEPYVELRVSGAAVRGIDPAESKHMADDFFNGPHDPMFRRLEQTYVSRALQKQRATAK